MRNMEEGGEDGNSELIMNVIVLCSASSDDCMLAPTPLMVVLTVVSAMIQAVFLSSLSRIG